MTSMREMIAGVEPFEMAFENAALETLLALESDLQDLRADFEDGWVEPAEYEFSKARILESMAKAKAQLNA